MRSFATLLKYAATAICAAGLVAPAALAQPASLDELFAQLAQPDNPEWRRVESDIQREWSRSGSPSMDLLLRRGKEAIEAGDLPAAIEHLTALTDHAPDFAEGWNARATAFFLAGQAGPSLADIQRTLALEPRHFGAITGLAVILEQGGRKAEALEAYRAAQALHPNRPDLKQAVERLERAVAGTDL